MKHLLALLILALATLSASAVPANPTPHVFTQPDGTQVTLRLCGDEFYHFTTTTDGYTVVQRSDGAWVYAIRNGATLAPSAVVAHDIGERTADETALTTVTPTHLTDLVAVEASKQARAAAHHPQTGSEGTARRAPANGPQRATTFDVSKFRGLIILVEPADVEFSMGDRAREFYDTLANAKNFTGFDYGDYGTWTGSVRDYFCDNSCGKFDPEFDVVGPVKVWWNATDFYANAMSVFTSAINKVNKDVDFSQYDGDNNGVVDMVFFIVAGYGSHYTGNDPGLLWPFQSTGLGSNKYDGKNIGRYACATELGGGLQNGFVEGIGTICHEFTHIMGFPDLYDVDFNDNGQVHHVDTWDIMASGNYNNNSRTPAGYSIFERYAFGFSTPEELNAKGTYSLESLGESNKGYILRSPLENEFFVLENRQQTSKWDQYLPGHGMLVTRIDSSNVDAWNRGRVCNDIQRVYYELLRAGNTTSGQLPSDPFPGTMDVTELSNTTWPNLRTWDGTFNNFNLTGIAEHDGVISFDLVHSPTAKYVLETFELLPLDMASGTEAPGDIATWKVVKSTVTDYNGSRQVELSNPSTVQTTTPLDESVYQVSAQVSNTGLTTAKLKLFYSMDNGQSWTAVNTITGGSQAEVNARSTSTAVWMMPSNEAHHTLFRLAMVGGNRCYVDNIAFYSKANDDDYEDGDVNNDWVVDIEDVNTLINVMLGFIDPSTLQGKADVNGDGNVDVADVNELVNKLLNIEPGETRTITVSNDTLTFAAKVGSVNVQEFTLRGENLTEPVTVEVIEGNDLFHVSATSVSTEDAYAGIKLTVTYCPKAANEAALGKLLLSSLGSRTVTVTLQGTATPPPTISKTNFTVNGATFTMVGLEGGTFTMGATVEQGSDYNYDELPAHQVTLSAFSIGETEVTQELWMAVMGSNPSWHIGANGYGTDLSRPVEQVNWDDCQEFIAKLNELTGESFRLPTEAEWEFAARGGQTQGYKYAGSSIINEVAWSDNMTHAVATKRPNEFGLYDMSGNVNEWCQDSPYGYSSEAQTDPCFFDSSSRNRVIRGGRVSSRQSYMYFMTDRYYFQGFRLAL